MRAITIWTTALVALTVLGFTAAPQTFNYQEYLNNSTGLPIKTDGEKGTCLYAETYN